MGSRVSKATAYAIASCIVIALTALPAGAALAGVNIFSNIIYDQTSSSAPSTPTTFYFAMGGSFQTLGDFDSAVANYPGPGSKIETVQGKTFNYTSPFFSSLANLHSAFPFGTYTHTVSNGTTNNSQSGVIDYAADYFTSAIPSLTASTYNSIYGMNPSLPFNIAFNTHTKDSHTNSGFVDVTIYVSGTVNSVFTTGLIPIGTLQLTLPADTLLPNQSYYTSVVFTDRLQGTDAVNHVTTFQGFDVHTRTSFTTGAVPEPAGAGLIGMGLLAFARRKRR